MKHNILFSFLLISLLTSGQAFSSQQDIVPKGKVLNKQSTIADILSDPKTAESRMKALSKEDAQGAQILCKLVMDPDTKFQDQAQEASMGTLKTLAFMRYCDGYKEETASLKKITQKPKLAEEQFEMPELKPVVLSFDVKVDNVSSQQQQLRDAKVVMVRNAEAIAKVSEAKRAAVQKITAQIEDTEVRIAEAQEQFDNLSAVILGFSFDANEEPLKSRFKVFKPGDHSASNPEAYLRALNTDLLQEDQYVLDSTSKASIMRATELLEAANANLEAARRDYERLNREMLELNK